MDEIKLLSLVMPSFRQEKTIVKNVVELNKALSSLDTNYELIVVIDGFVDKTREKLKKVRGKNIRILGYKDNLGKGHAVRYGMLRAKGDVIGFIDAGMDIDPTGIDMLLNHMIWYNADIIVGSKLHPVSQVEYPFFRKILSWGYRSINRVLFGLKIRDTQVGIKLYKRKVVMDVFPKLLVKEFAFDVETLAAAHSLGYKRIYDAPIKLKYHPGSIDLDNYLKIVWNMLRDTAAVYYRVKFLDYYNKQQTINNKK